MNMKNITRYNGGDGDRKGFRGWRLCITRSKEVFVRYFTDREFGSEEASLEAALAMRQEMQDALATFTGEPAELFARYRKGKPKPVRRRRRAVRKAK